MVGGNTPQAFPASLAEYTLQWWMAWETSVFNVATGFSPTILDATSTGPSGGGIRVQMMPVVPLHEWRLTLAHVVGGVPVLSVFPYVFNQELGWKMFSIRYKESTGAIPELFVDSVKVADGSVVLPQPTQLSLGDPIQIMDTDLVGGFDQIRMLSRKLEDAEIVSSYGQCVNEPTSISYKWVMQILVDGRMYGERKIESDERRIWTDFTVPVRILTGVHTVSFRLKLETS